MNVAIQSATPAPAAGGEDDMRYKSHYWQQQVQLAQVSCEASSSHSYASDAARRSKGGMSEAPMNVADLALQMIKHDKAAGLAGNALSSTQFTPSRPRANVSNTQEKRELIEEERQRHINEDINKQFWTAIDLSGQGLLSVSPRLLHYNFLQKLFLNHNNLGSVPLCITKMHHLKVLDLSHNLLVELPSEMGLMYSLRYLFLFHNRIKRLPFELGSLFQLDLLGIEGNPLVEEQRSTIAEHGTRDLIVSLRDNAPQGDPPKPREWIQLEDEDLSRARFSLLSYNTLCERYATPQMYGYTPSWALAWEYRSQLLVEQVLAQDTDIVCLQEINRISLDRLWIPALLKCGYDYVYHPKTRSRTMANEGDAASVDGCVLFYKTSVFKLLHRHTVDFNSKALGNDSLKRSQDVFNRIMVRDNIALIAVLQHLETNRLLEVATTHVHWDPAYPDVKLVQTAILMEEAEALAATIASSTSPLGQQFPNIKNISQIPTIICGDFNSSKNSGVYELLDTGSVSADHTDLKGYRYGTYTDVGIHHKFHLNSSYSEGVQLPFTNYTPDFVEVIDYIWHTNQLLNVEALLGPIDEAYVAKHVGFPNAHNPSDHIPIAASFSFKGT